MKKILIFFYILTAYNSYSQTPVHTIAKTYLREHPFDMKFSSFVLSLQKDPWFTIDIYNRRTDSTFFFLSGTYKNFNPFHYTPIELRLVIAEEEIIHSDSLQTHDTIMNLQLMGVADSGAANSKVVEKEFRRFHKSQSERFSDNTYKSLGGKSGLTGEIYNYFISPLSISPVTIAWGLMPDTEQYTFTITIRFKVKENMANYIVGPGEL